MTDDPLADVKPLAPLMHTFFSCHRAILTTLRGDMRARGLAPDEFDVLVVLAKGDRRTCKEIANQLMVPNPTLTRTLARLQGRGLLQFTRGERDGRQKFVSLTPAGRALHEAVFLPHIRLVGRCVGHLTPAEQAQLDRLLHGLATGFTAESGPASPNA